MGATVLCLCSNIIDVSAADSQGMEQHEYMDRARQYRWDLLLSPGVSTVPSQPCVSLGRSQGFWPGGRELGMSKGCCIWESRVQPAQGRPMAVQAAEPRTKGSCVHPALGAGGGGLDVSASS